MRAEARTNPDYRFAWYVIAGSTPVVVVAILTESLITGPLRSLWVVAVALVLWSGVMWWAERRPSQRLGEKDLRLREVLGIGIVQCASLVPGVSRSGATISAGLDQARIAACHEALGGMEVALTGGVFQNRLLAGLCEDAVRRAGLSVLDGGLIPVNDGGVSLGQAAVAGYATLRQRGGL